MTPYFVRRLESMMSERTGLAVSVQILDLPNKGFIEEGSIEVRIRFPYHPEMMNAQAIVAMFYPKSFVKRNENKLLTESTPLTDKTV